MLRYSLKRLLLAFVTAFIIITLTFILVKALPEPVKISANEDAKWSFYITQVQLGYFNVIEKPVTEHYQPTINIIESMVRDKSEYFFYQRPILDQYFSWLGNVLKGNWGTSTSLELNADAIRLIGRRLPTTMSINIIVVLLSVPLGILLGIYAGLKKNTWIDHTISTLIMIFVSIPGFVVITFLIFFLSYQTGGWLPPSWPSSEAPLGTRILGYIIPVLALSFGSICGYGRGVRAELCEVMSSEYLLLARTKGLTKNQAIVRHALRNAFVPILPSVLAEFIGILGGSIVLERLYGIPGVGNIYFEALNNTPRDYNVLMVDMVIFTIIGLLAGILFDLSYGFIDPRIRMGAKKQLCQKIKISNSQKKPLLLMKK